VRIVVGKRGLTEGQVEMSLRRDGIKNMVPLGEVIPEVRRVLAELAAEIDD